MFRRSGRLILVWGWGRRGYGSSAGEGDYWAAVFVGEAVDGGVGGYFLADGFARPV